MYSTSEFRLYLLQLQLKQASIASYMRDAVQFCEYIKQHNKFNISKVTKEDIEKYCEKMVRGGTAIVSLQRKMVSLRKLFNFLQKIGQTQNNPVLGIKFKKEYTKIQKVLTKEEIRKLLSIPNQTTAIGIRDKAMLQLVWATGIKATELVSIDMDRLCLDRKELHLSRHNESTYIALDNDTCKCLLNYIEKSRIAFLNGADDRTLFYNAYGQCLSRQGFWKIVKKYSDMAGLEYVTPETIRRSFAVHFTNTCTDMHSLSKILGHSNIAITRAYIRQ